MGDYIVLAVLVAVIAAIVIYLYRAKKRGDKCIGCPYGKQCSGKCNGGCQSQNINNLKDE